MRKELIVLVPAAREAHGVRVDPVAGDLGCLVLLHPFVLAFLSFATLRVTHFAREAEGALPAVPIAAGDRIQTNAIIVVTSVAEIAEQHFILVRVVLAAGANLALGALPPVARDVLQQLEVQAQAGHVVRLTAFGAVKQLLGNAELVPYPVARADATRGPRHVSVNGLLRFHVLLFALARVLFAFLLRIVDLFFLLLRGRI